MLINPLKKSVDYKGLKSAGYRRINMDKKVNCVRGSSLIYIVT
jgi:hypothetical protein